MMNSASTQCPRCKQHVYGDMFSHIRYDCGFEALSSIPPALVDQNAHSNTFADAFFDDDPLPFVPRPQRSRPTMDRELEQAAIQNFLQRNTAHHSHLPREFNPSPGVNQRYLSALSVAASVPPTHIAGNMWKTKGITCGKS